MDIENRNNVVEGGDIEFLDLGFVISTSDSEVIKDNARERFQYDEMLTEADGMTADGDIKPEMWETISNDIMLMEERFVDEIKRVMGFTMRMEGHDSYGDLLGSCWVDLNKYPEALKFVFHNANDAAQEPGTEPHEIEGIDQDVIYKDVCKITYHSVDINFGFIDITKDDYSLLEDIVDLPIEEAIKKLHEHCGLEKEK